MAINGIGFSDRLILVRGYAASLQMDASRLGRLEGILEIQEGLFFVYFFYLLSST